MAPRHLPSLRSLREVICWLSSYRGDATCRTEGVFLQAWPRRLWRRSFLNRVGGEGRSKITVLWVFLASMSKNVFFPGAPLPPKTGGKTFLCAIAHRRASPQS